MPRVSDMFPKPHITVGMLEDKPHPLTIRNVVRKAVFNPGTNQEEQVWVVYFEKAKRYLILNITNADKIAEIAGSEEADKWVGLQIVLYPTWVEAFGDTVLGIRIRKLKEDEFPNEVAINKENGDAKNLTKPQ